MICPYVKLEKQFKSKVTKETFRLKNTFHCKTEGVIYLTECSKCGIQYVGQTARTFCARMREHRGDIINKRDTANAMHYNSKGHSLDDFRTTIIERVIPNGGA